MCPLPESKCSSERDFSAERERRPRMPLLPGIKLGPYEIQSPHRAAWQRFMAPVVLYRGTSLRFPTEHPADGCADPALSPVGTTDTYALRSCCRGLCNRSTNMPRAAVPYGNRREGLQPSNCRFAKRPGLPEFKVRRILSLISHPDTHPETRRPRSTFSRGVSSVTVTVLDVSCTPRAASTRIQASICTSAFAWNGLKPGAVI